MKAFEKYLRSIWNKLNFQSFNPVKLSQILNNFRDKFKSSTNNDKLLILKKLIHLDTLFRIHSMHKSNKDMNICVYIGGNFLIHALIMKPARPIIDMFIEATHTSEYKNTVHYSLNASRCSMH